MAESTRRRIPGKGVPLVSITENPFDADSKKYLINDIWYRFFIDFASESITVGGVSGTGILSASGSNLVYRTLTSADSLASWTNANGVAGNPVLTINQANFSIATTQLTGTITNAQLAGSITAAKLVGTDIATVGTITAGVWQGTSISTTYTDAKLKTLTGTANRITIGGTATDPTVDIHASYVGQNTITTLGTVTTGTWSATTIAVDKGGSGRTSSTAYAVICGGTTGTGAHQSIAAVGSSGQVLTSNGAGALPSMQDIPHKVVQQVRTTVSAVSTGTTVFPVDDTIPQNTEGDEYMTLAITPTNSANILLIEVVFIGSNSAAPLNIGVGLFQDTTAGALAGAINYTAAAAAINTIAFSYRMTAGTTSATTFKVRAGGESAGTLTFNGVGGNRRLGGVIASSITITEIRS